VEIGKQVCYNWGMDIKELDKKQLILLTLLITFVVSIGTGIVTVSLMKQMPQTVPQTINNVIQRTIEKVTTVETPVTETNTNNSVNTEESLALLSSNSDALIPIYRSDEDLSSLTGGDTSEIKVDPIGQGIIISEAGLILVDSNILDRGDLYKVILDKTEFNASILKSFGNGFTVLRISAIRENSTDNTNTTDTTGNTDTTTGTVTE